MRSNLNTIDELLTTFPKESRFLDLIATPQLGDDERLVLNRVFLGKGWMDIDLKAVKSSYPGPISEIPGLMTDEAIAYFFPFFIKCIRGQPGQCDSLPEALLFRLVRDLRDDGQIKNKLKSTQRKYIAKFLHDEFDGAKSYQADIQKVSKYLED